VLVTALPAEENRLSHGGERVFLVMFDIDGTLTESYAYDQQVYADAFFDATGSRDVDTDWHNYRHVTSHGITREALGNHWGRDALPDEVRAVERAVLKRLQALHRREPEQFCEVAGASAFLAYLRRRGDVAVSIATGCWLSEALFKLQSSGIDISGIPLAASEDGGSRIEIMAASQKKALHVYKRTSFERVIYFGDGIWNVNAAAGLGYAFIGIGQRLDKLGEAGAPHLHRDYSNPEALTATLKGMVSR